MTKPGAEVTTQDLEILERFYTAASPTPENWPEPSSTPNWSEEYGTHEHLQLAQVAATVLTEKLQETTQGKTDEESERIKAINPTEMAALGLLHDLGRVVIHSIYRTDAVSKMLFDRLGIRPDLTAKLHSIDFFYGRWPTPEGGRTFISQTDQISIEQRILKMADNLAKRQRDTGKIRTLDELFAGYGNWIKGYTDRPSGKWATAKKFQGIAAENYGPADIQLLGSVRDWMTNCGVDFEKLYRGVIERFQDLQTRQLDYDPTTDQSLYRKGGLLIGKEHPKAAQISACTIAGSPEKPNEDAYALKTVEGVLVIGAFDGASSKKPITALKTQTGARFASHFLRNRFNEVLPDLSPKELMVTLNSRLLTANQEIGGHLGDTHTLPGSTGTIIKIDSDRDRLEIAHISDSFCVIYYRDGHSETVTLNTNKVFDEQVFALMEKIAKDRGITPREAHQTKEIQEAKLETAQGRDNNPNGKGSGLLNGDPNVEQYIQEIVIPLNEVKAVLLGTDGLIPQGWTLEKNEDRQRLYEDLKEGGFERLISIKHQSEDEDPDWHHIRYKHSDDATGILLSFS